MSKEDDDKDNIVIERIKSGKSANAEPSKSEVKKNKSKSSKTKKDRAKTGSKSKPAASATPKSELKDYGVQGRVTGLLLSGILFFILLSLLSYTRSDQMNINFSFSEIFGIFSDDSIISAKADMTQNWLGLLGAKISNFIYNSLFGVIGLFGVLICFVPAVNLMTDARIKDRTYHLLVTAAIYSVVFSVAIGSWNLVFTDMGTEWSGAVGYFIASGISNLLGNAGTILIANLGFVGLILMNLNLNWDSILQRGGVAAKRVSVEASGNLKSRLTRLKGELGNRLTKKGKSKDNDGTVDDLMNEEASPDADVAVDSAGTRRVDLDDGSELRERATLVGDGQVERDKAAETQEILIKKREVVKSLLEDDTDDDSAMDLVRRFKSASGSPLDNAEETVSQVSEEGADTIGIGTDDDMPRESGFQQGKSLPTVQSEGRTVVEADSDGETVKSESSEKAKELADKTEDIDVLTDELESFISGLPDQSSLVEMKGDGKEEAESGGGQKDPLRVTVLEKDKPEYDEPISTAIHDREIDYVFPGISLLDKDMGINKVEDSELRMNAQTLEQKLQTFRITIKNLEVTPGPVVTQYEFVPGDGIKVSRIEGLSDDLAMALKAKGIRIIAPIPGKGTVGVEIPNNNPSLVTFSSVIATKTFRDCDFQLPIAFGKDISGDIYMLDLAKMPHLLIAGSTGSGKSVGVNGIIASLLYKKHPSELKFVIIDPKQVEMTQFKALRNHYMAASPDVRDTIITDPEDAKSVLNSTVEEMENRYTILSKVGQRNIEEYNRKVKQGKLKGDKNMVHREMPYIVVIIDEFADLIMTAGKEVETPIVRLAQKARAIGIHIVLATQRPSVNVITGLIKANFPARVSYMVASKIDSRTILDGPGADKLLGRGDALVLPPGKPKPDRVQNSFITTEEIENICEHIESQQGYAMPYMLPSVAEESESVGNIDPNDRDPLFMEAVGLLISAGKGSTSMIQRQLRIGYARAGRMMDELEAAGVVGPPKGSKPRDILISSIDEVR